MDHIDDEARLFWGNIVKTKHQSLTSLAFMRLFPGADQAVRHICIRCIRSSKQRPKAPGFKITHGLLTTSFTVTLLSLAKAIIVFQKFNLEC